jgi:hypothetical protein
MPLTSSGLGLSRKPNANKHFDLVTSTAVTTGFRQLHGMVLELVYRAEDRCNSSGAPAGTFPSGPRGQVGPGSGPKSKISGPTHSHPPDKNLKTLLTALEAPFGIDLANVGATWATDFCA